MFLNNEILIEKKRLREKVCPILSQSRNNKQLKDIVSIFSFMAY